ncbi:hypothetical protein C8R43DRAFT_966081 [Mycena crocata]|nr:hypothetical protein C8R43DRAFT_966081 [Mycena crocata]
MTVRGIDRSVEVTNIQMTVYLFSMEHGESFSTLFTLFASSGTAIRFAEATNSDAKPSNVEERMHGCGRFDSLYHCDAENEILSSRVLLFEIEIGSQRWKLLKNWPMLVPEKMEIWVLNHCRWLTEQCMRMFNKPRYESTECKTLYQPKEAIITLIFLYLLLTSSPPAVFATGGLPDIFKIPDVARKALVTPNQPTGCQPHHAAVGLSSSGDAEDIDAEIVVTAEDELETGKQKRWPNQQSVNFWRDANDKGDDLDVPGLEEGETTASAERGERRKQSVNLLITSNSSRWEILASIILFQTRNRHILETHQKFEAPVSIANESGGSCTSVWHCLRASLVISTNTGLSQEIRGSGWPETYSITLKLELGRRGISTGTERYYLSTCVQSGSSRIAANVVQHNQPSQHDSAWKYTFVKVESRRQNVHEYSSLIYGREHPLACFPVPTDPTCAVLGQRKSALRHSRRERAWSYAGWLPIQHHTCTRAKIRRDQQHENGKEEKVKAIFKTTPGDPDALAVREAKQIEANRDVSMVIGSSCKSIPFGFHYSPLTFPATAIKRTSQRKEPFGIYHGAGTQVCKALSFFKVSSLRCTEVMHFRLAFAQPSQLGVSVEPTEVTQLAQLFPHSQADCFDTVDLTVDFTHRCIVDDPSDVNRTKTARSRGTSWPSRLDLDLTMAVQLPMNSISLWNDPVSTQRPRNVGQSEENVVLIVYLQITCRDQCEVNDGWGCHKEVEYSFGGKFCGYSDFLQVALGATNEGKNSLQLCIAMTGHNFHLMQGR